MTTRTPWSPNVSLLQEEFEGKALPLIQERAKKHINGGYASPRAQMFWLGWLKERSKCALPVAHFNLLPTTTLLEFNGMKVCSDDVGEPGYTFSQIEAFYGCGASRPDLLKIFESPIPDALLEHAGGIAANVLLTLPKPLCYVRPAATLPGHGGRQVWKDDGTTEPAVTRSALLKALVPQKTVDATSPDTSCITATVTEVVALMVNKGAASPQAICTSQSGEFARRVYLALSRGAAPSARMMTEALFRLFDDSVRMQLQWNWPLLEKKFAIRDCPPFSQAVLDKVHFDGYSWIEVDGLHFDAETPFGVRNFFELPHMQRLIAAQRNLLP